MNVAKWIPKVGDSVLVWAVWEDSEHDPKPTEKFCVVVRREIAKDRRQPIQARIWVEPKPFRPWTNERGTGAIEIRRTRDLLEHTSVPLFAIEFEPEKWCYFHNFVVQFKCDPSEVIYGWMDDYYLDRPRVGWFEFPRPKDKPNVGVPSRT